MSSYNGRRAPNVSQYIANLNTIPSVADTASQPDFGPFQDDLDLFTNTQFFDFDMNESVPKMDDLGGLFSADRPQTRPQQGPVVVGQDAQGNQPTFQFPDFSFPQAQSMTGHSLPPSPPTALAPYPTQQPAQPAFAASPVTGEKRKSTAASIASPADFEEHSRHAAEEDKRRRNTAASARFRVKKKQREQALEKSAKEMSDKVQFLEARVGQLEMENKWLKGLITEKNLKVVDASSTQSESDKPKANSDSSSEKRKDGVGTEVEAAKATA
ncbi:hypothetical protein AAFC00_003000 [Neodothiora populina]|uniref:BZIP domain-containing protein n=1 Tax=Neodothiora populina TaxID=2781224 RepID=A0ABR3P9C0_9PEZI